MDLCCIMLMLGCILSGVSNLFILLAMFCIYSGGYCDVDCPTGRYTCPYTSVYDSIRLQTGGPQWQATCAFHVMALLWCIATTVLFGVGLCAPPCREDNNAFMVGLLVCCGLWSLCNLIATALFGYYQYPGDPPGICDYSGTVHSDHTCFNEALMFGFLLFGLVNSAACCAFAGIACAV